MPKDNIPLVGGGKKMSTESSGWLKTKSQMRGFEHCGHRTEKAALAWQKEMENQGYLVKLVYMSRNDAGARIYALFRRRKRKKRGPIDAPVIGDRVRARYDYLCEKCGVTIKKGEEHRVESSYTETHRTHLDCPPTDFGCSKYYYENEKQIRAREEARKQRMLKKKYGYVIPPRRSR